MFPLLGFQGRVLLPAERRFWRWKCRVGDFRLQLSLYHKKKKEHVFYGFWRRLRGRWVFEKGLWRIWLVTIEECKYGSFFYPPEQHGKRYIIVSVDVKGTLKIYDLKYEPSNVYFPAATAGFDLQMHLIWRNGTLQFIHRHNRWPNIHGVLFPILLTKWIMI